MGWLCLLEALVFLFLSGPHDVELLPLKILDASHFKGKLEMLLEMFAEALDGFFGDRLLIVSKDSFDSTFLGVFLLHAPLRWTVLATPVSEMRPVPSGPCIPLLLRFAPWSRTNVPLLA